MTESIADRLALAAEQLGLTSERMGGMTADDMAAVADYLLPLAEHGFAVCERALKAIEATDPGHPTRGVARGLDLQGALCSSSDLFGVLIHFAYEAREAAGALTQGDPS
jgi:hypothetical protein